MNKKYIIITPVRDEEKYISKTIISVVNQSILPAEWIIINDGSTDNTEKIVNYYCKIYPWIRIYNREDRGCRKPGGGVIEAFYHGFSKIRVHDWNYLVKLDGDLSFDKNYFEQCLSLFEKNTNLGIGGGEIHNLVDNKLILEKTPTYHVRGATKIYQRRCWESIGGLIAAPGWDSLDELKANQLGWETKTFKNLMLIHYRYTGAADGVLNNLIKFGLANYIAGYSPIFMVAKCFKHLYYKPLFIGALALFFGFVKGYIGKTKKINDPGLIEFVRKQQKRCLMGKESIWGK